MATTHNLALQPLSAAEARMGYNFKHTFTWQELKNNSDPSEATATNHTYRMFPLYTGAFVKGVYLHLEEIFTFPSGASVAAYVGDTNDDNGFVTSVTLSGSVSAGNYVFGNNGAYFDSTDTTSSNGETNDVTVTLASTTNSKKYSNANSTTANTWLEVVVNPVGLILDDLTAGRFTVYVDAVIPS